MNTARLTARFTADHLRNPVNLLVLALVPVAFVLVAAGPLAAVGDKLGAAGVPIEVVAPGWAAGFIAAVGMYFQVSSARWTDRRLVVAGLARSTLVLARVGAGAAVAALATGSALVAMVARGDVDQPARAAVGAAVFAVIYLALGGVVGAFVVSALNGTMLLLFIWIVDVFFGPAMNGTEYAALRALPTHDLTLWMTGREPGHGGPGTVLMTLAWVLGTGALAYLSVLRTTSIGRARTPAATYGALHQLATGLRMSWRTWRRTPVFWVLLVVVPTVFIWLADAVTPSGSTMVRLRENGADVVTVLDPAAMHAGTMAPIAIGSLAALAGVFIGVEARGADQRLVLAGQPRRTVLTTRLAAAVAAAGVATVASLAITAPLFDARQWVTYAAGNALVAVTYGLVGVVLGPLVGRLSGALIAFLAPFLDLAIGQSPMLQEGPAGWARLLPGYSGTRLVLDGGLTPSFDEAGSLLLAAGWIAGLLVVAAVLFRRERASAPATGPVA